MPLARIIKTIYVAITTCLLIASVAHAGESALTTTYQPLAGLGAGDVKVVQVTCHHWYAHGSSSPVDLIHLRNVPPTDNPQEATEDLNLSSRCGLKFSINDFRTAGSVPIVLLDATLFDATKSGGYDKEAVIRASLECLRRCLPVKWATTKVSLRCKDADKEWLVSIVSQFNKAPKDKVFYKAQ